MFVSKMSVQERLPLCFVIALITWKNNSSMFKLNMLFQNSFRKCGVRTISTLEFVSVLTVVFVKLGSRSKVYLKSLRDLDLELVAIIAMSPPPPPTMKLF